LAKIIRAELRVDMLCIRRQHPRGSGGVVSAGRIPTRCL